MISADPLFWVHILDLPLNLLGVVLNGCIVHLLLHSTLASAVTATRARVLMVLLLGSNGVWSLFVLITGLMTVISLAPSAALETAIAATCAGWVVISLWLNLALAVDRSCHIHGKGRAISGILMLIMAVACFGSCSFITWAFSAKPLTSPEISAIWSIIIPYTLAFTFAITILCYICVYVHATSKFDKLHDDTPNLKKAIIKNSFFMALSFLVSFTPFVALIIWINNASFLSNFLEAPDWVILVIGAVTVLGSLDPILTACIALYFLPEVRVSFFGVGQSEADSEESSEK